MNTAHEGVMDCRRVDACVDTDALLAREVDQAAQGGSRLPMALLVHRRDLHAWQRYCWDAAQRGFMRAAFTHAAPALSWAEEQAALWAAQAAHRASKAARGTHGLQGVTS